MRFIDLKTGSRHPPDPYYSLTRFSFSRSIPILLIYLPRITRALSAISPSLSFIHPNSILQPTETPASTANMKFFYVAAVASKQCSTSSREGFTNIVCSDPSLRFSRCVQCVQREHRGLRNLPNNHRKSPGRHPYFRTHDVVLCAGADRRLHERSLWKPVWVPYRQCAFVSHFYASTVHERRRQDWRGPARSRSGRGVRRCVRAVIGGSKAPGRWTSLSVRFCCWGCQSM